MEINHVCSGGWACFTWTQSMYTIMSDSGIHNQTPVNGHLSQAILKSLAMCKCWHLPRSLSPAQHSHSTYISYHHGLIPSAEPSVNAQTHILTCVQPALSTCLDTLSNCHGPVLKLILESAMDTITQSGILQAKYMYTLPSIAIYCNL